MPAKAGTIHLLKEASMMTLPGAEQIQGYYGLLQSSFRLYRKSIKRTFLLALLLAFVSLMPRLVLIAWGVEYIANHPKALLLYSLFLIFTYIACLWFLATIFWRVYCTAKNRHERLFEDFTKGRKKLVYLMGAAFLILSLSLILNAFAWSTNAFILPFLFPPASVFTWIALFLVFLIEMVVLIYCILLFVFYIPLIVIENDGVFKSLRDSAALVWRHARETFIFQISSLIIYLLFLLLIKNIFYSIFAINFLNETPSLLLYIVMNTVVLALGYPFFVTQVLTQLHNLELKKLKHV